MKQSIDVLINMDPNDVSKMTEKELRSAVSTLSSAANKRLSRLGETKIGRESIAYQEAQKRAYTGTKGGKFGTMGKGWNELRSEFSSARNFLRDKTSTVSGWADVRKKTAERLNQTAKTSDYDYQEIDEEDLDRAFWREYRDYMNSNPSATSYLGSEYIQSRLAILRRQKRSRADRWRKMDDFIENAIAGREAEERERAEREEADLWEDPGDGFTELNDEEDLPF